MGIVRIVINFIYELVKNIVKKLLIIIKWTIDIEKIIQKIKQYLFIKINIYLYLLVI
jgi:hypothetical protein